MELYILDKLYRRVELIDTYESLIWTERFQATGDFELKIRSTRALRNLLRPGVMLAMSESNRVMMIDEVEDSIEESGDILQVSGESFEKIFQDRVLWYQTNHVGPWYLTTSPIGLPYELFSVAMADSSYPFLPNPPFDINATIPLLATRVVPPDPFAEGVEDVIDWVQEKPNTLYNELLKACEEYKLGFRVVREDNPAHLYFEAYTGRDLTTRQTNREPVVFSVKLENLQNTKEYYNQKGFKNVAFVYTGEGEFVWVGPPPFDPVSNASGNYVGENRRVLSVQSTPPSGYTGDVYDYLRLVGRRALLDQRHQGYHIFEGELNQRNDYAYGVDYQLGDVVELRNRDGEVTYKHVTEQIFISDLNGIRSYPSLSVGVFDTYDTWKLYDEPQLGAYVWEDFEFSQEGWGDM